MQCRKRHFCIAELRFSQARPTRRAYSATINWRRVKRPVRQHELLVSVASESLAAGTRARLQQQFLSTGSVAQSRSLKPWPRGFSRKVHGTASGSSSATLSMEMLEHSHYRLCNGDCRNRLYARGDAARCFGRHFEGHVNLSPDRLIVRDDFPIRIHVEKCLALDDASLVEPEDPDILVGVRRSGCRG